MFNKQYFDEYLPWQWEQLGEGRGSVFLFNGTELKLFRIDKALDGYVLLQVYPDDGVTDETKEERRKPGGTQEVFWDRVAISYDAISHVWLSVTEPEREAFIGFET